ncbi:O-antigen ligase family protein [Butyrivibrio fibrisolvens]|nr:O-antigen ligase family protein [Butyrivibrio fibrisolvens]
MLSPTKEEYITLLKSVVWTSNILFLVGIFESITFIKPFDILYTVSRGIINESQVKFGLLRATTTMLMPIIYGNVCVLLFPLILYVYEITRKKIYIVSSVLCFLAIIHSGCRSSVLYFIAILGIYFILIIKKRDRRIQFSKTLTVVIICFLVIYTFLPTNLHFYYSATAKSVLNEVGFNFDVNEGAPNESMKISMTGRGSTPRIVQLSGIYYTALHHPIFGFGAGAQNRDDLKYYFYQKWQTIHTFDNGLVEIFCSEGIIGTLALASLLIFITLNLHKRKFYLLSFIAYLLTTISTINLFTFLFFIIAININWDYKPE